MTLWQHIKLEIKERFGNFTALRGAFLLPAGLFGIWVTWTHLQYVIQAAATIGFAYIAIDGARKLLKNPVKQALAFEKAKQTRLAAEGTVTTTQKVPAPGGES